MAEYVKSELGLDYAYANDVCTPPLQLQPPNANESVILKLIISEDGTELTGPIIDAKRKGLLLEEIAQKEGIHLKQTQGIGNGVTDLIMIQKAGFGITLNSTPKVKAVTETPCRLYSRSLKNILYILGFGKGEQEDLLALSS